MSEKTIQPDYTNYLWRENTVNEITLFSFRRIIVSSLVLGIITLLFLNSALGTSSNSNIDENPQPSSTTTTSQNTSTQDTSNTDTTTDSNEVLTTVVTATVAETNEPNFAEDDIRASEMESEDAFGPIKIFSFSNEDYDLKDYLFIGGSFVVFSGLFFSMFFIFYFFIYNNKELTLYLNHSLNKSGFQHKISQIGKKWIITANTGKQFSMNLVGIRKLRMEIILPVEENMDPREYGFRPSTTNATTYADLDVLPMRLQVVRLYVTALG